MSLFKRKSKEEEQKKEVKSTKTEKKEVKVEETEKKEVKKTERKAVYRVVYNKEERIWQIKKDGAKRVITSYPTKEEALKRVKELCESNDMNVIIHKKDGKFQKKKI